MSLTLELANPNAYVQYNGVFFGKPNEAKERAPEAVYQLSHADFRVKCDAVYNASGTNVESLQYVIECRGYLIASDNYGRELGLADLRARLMIPKKTLGAFGFGIHVDDVGREVPDITWGPKPLNCDMTPIGDLGSIVNWTIAFEVPPCFSPGKSEFKRNNIRSFVYSSTYSNDSEGTTSRTVTGSFKIYQNQASVTNQAAFNTNAVFPDNYADNFRKQINIPVPRGFRRIQNEWTSSRDKIRVNFTITDRQFKGTAFFPYISNATGSYSYQNANEVGQNGAQGIPTFVKQNHTLSMTITTALGYHPALAGIHFFNSLRAKVLKLRQSVKRNAMNDDQIGKDPVIYPTSLKVQTGLFDDVRTTRFSATFMVVGAEKNYLFDEMWHPLPYTEYDDWINSMADAKVTDPYGTSGLKENPDFSSVINNLCESKNPTNIREEIFGQEEGETNITTPWECNHIDPKYSYIQYESEITTRREMNISIHKAAYGIGKAAFAGVLLGADAARSVVSSVQGILPYAETYKNDLADAAGEAGVPAEDVDPVEIQGFPETTITVTFRISRVGHKVPMPALRTATGVKLIEIDRIVVNKESAWGGCTVYSMSGKIMYRALGEVNKTDLALFNPTLPEGSTDQLKVD